MKQVEKDIYRHFKAIKKLMLKKGPVLKKMKMKEGQKLPVELRIQDENTYEMLGSVKVWFTKGELRGAKVTLIEICKRVLETGTYCTSNCETLPKAQILARACKFMYEQLESISIMDLVSPPYQKFAQDVLEEVDSLVLTKENERLIERVDPKDILDD